MSEYYYYRESAYPWKITWPKLKYKIVDKDTMLSYRKILARFMADQIPHLKNIAEEELQLPYDQYLVPKHLFDGSNPLGNDFQPPVYDPFEIFNETPSNKRVDLPYADFSTLDVNDSEAIVNFANKHGLIGIFFHRYHYLPLVNPANGTDSNDTAEATFLFANKKNVKRKGKIHLPASRGLWFSKPVDKEGLIPMDIKQINDTFFPFQLDPYEAVDISLKYYDKLTPLPANLNFDTPINWWYIYCEPLPLFIREVERFKDTLFKLIELGEQQDEKERKRKLSHVLFHLKQNLEKVHPTPSYSNNVEVDKSHKGGLTEGWNFPSLLSAYYLMLYLQISGNRESRLCARKRCNRPFFINRKDNYHCSDECQASEKTQRQRDKLKRLIKAEENTRNQYFPGQVKYLLVMGVPEIKEQLFSYQELQDKNSFPFIATVFAFYPNEYKKAEVVYDKMDEILHRFKRDGIFAIDAIERNRFKEYSPAKIKRLINNVANENTKIILVGITEGAHDYLQKSICGVIVGNIHPYPDDVKKGKEYMRNLKRLLKETAKTILNSPIIIIFFSTK